MVEAVVVFVVFVVFVVVHIGASKVLHLEAPKRTELPPYFGCLPSLLFLAHSLWAVYFSYLWYAHETR